MHISVGVCTWNRAQLLDKTLASMGRLRVPNGVEWELLVVNNNSADNTEDIISKHQVNLPIRRLFEPVAGKSNALNHAIREAQGEFILWTDDDVSVEPDWMAEYAEAFVRWPGAAFFGGPVKPWFDGTPPAWLKSVFPRVASAYATRDLGDEPIQFTRRVIPYGANMAVRTTDQARYLYNTKLGPRGQSPLRGEDAEVVRQMLADGLNGRWVPKAVVQHYIPASRQTLKYLRSYYQGLGEYYAGRLQEGGIRRWLKKARWLWKAARAGVAYNIHWFLARPDDWIEDLIKCNVAWGQLRGVGKKRLGASYPSQRRIMRII